MKRPRFEVRRTTEGTVFEVAFVLLTIIVWVLVIMMLNAAPDTVPTHFGPSGAPDSYGEKHEMLFPCIITWVVGFCCLAGAYFPHTVNIPFVEIANTTQAALASRMMRVMALLMVTMTATHAFDALRGRFLFTAVILIALLVVCIVFGILIAKRK